VFNDSGIWKSLHASKRLTLIAGPCVIENEKLCLWVAASLKRTCDRLGIFYVFKASFDKANRTSGKSFRGPGVEAGLKTLAKVRSEIGVPVLTDIHKETEAAPVAQVVGHLANPGVPLPPDGFDRSRRRDGQDCESQEGTVPFAR